VSQATLSRARSVKHYEDRVCLNPKCGQTFTPRRQDQRNCSTSCHNASRTQRGRSDTSKQSSRKRDKRRVLESIENRSYVGWDGEGINVWQEYTVDVAEDGTEIKDAQERHNYTYMAWSTETGEFSELECKPGDTYIRTQDALWFVWSTPKKASIWGYSTKYDWTKILSDVDYDTLWQIYHADQNPDGTIRDTFEPVWWEGWGISYVQGSVKLSRMYSNEQKTFPVSKFYQDGFRCWGGGSFLTQLKNWEVGTEEELAEVERMKNQRSYFTRMTEEIKRYCRLEVKLLAQLAKKISVTFSELGYRPLGGRAYSSGSYAKAMMRVHHIPADPKSGWEGYRGTDRYAGAPDDIINILMRTYFGGRFEQRMTGIFKELHSHDLAAAYVHTLKFLPCLSHGHWERKKVDGAANFGHVRWNGDGDFGPFPWRHESGAVFYPMTGQGWYAEAEITAAQLQPSWNIEELEWISFVPECDHKPFTWVQAEYNKRVEWGKDGKGKALKVALLSCYGSIADTVAVDSRYASMVWASMITAGTRAKLLQKIAEHPGKVIATATDGILTTEPVDHTEKRKILGEWDYEGKLNDVILVQPGFYFAGSGDDPAKYVRTRGMSAKDGMALEPELRAAWLRDGWNAVVKYTAKVFIPAKLALARRNWREQYGQWLDLEKSIKFRPSRRDPDYGDGLAKTSSVDIWTFLWDEHGDLIDSAQYSKLASMRAHEKLKEQQELRESQP